MALTCLIYLSSVSGFAATPKDIKYASKGNALIGGKYYIYNVRCSDGKTRKISSWDKRKKWCVGTSKRNCSNDQLKTAKKACK
ncbi:hypothetical protein [Candidatus Venteria ishoeyi]|uniref:hypothetical protein n=1 Tax=Candidatus Venteria ishoeyi TaxID=1899563 RepID=UPI0015B18EFC|nr:hypothetical protein [Candidatus Venteria ishoeyi]